MTIQMQDTGAGEINAVKWSPESRLTNSDNWRVVNDDVMGGISNGDFEIKGQIVSFNGVLSMQNNGGFASIVYFGLERMSASDKGFVIRVKGDGRTYQLRFNMQGQYSGVSYMVSFLTNGEQQQLYFPFAEFDPVYRGRDVYDAPRLSPDKINQLRFLIADKNTAPFDLQILGFGHVSDQ